MNNYITKIKSELIDYNYYVDRRIIYDLIVKLINKNNASIKKSIIETLANVLHLSNEDRTSLGISNIQVNSFGELVNIIHL